MSAKFTEQQSRDYILKHGILLPNRQVLLMEPLAVFKKVNTYPKPAEYYRDKKNRLNYARRYPVYAIASLIIPRGAFVNLNEQRSMKCRADKAFCHTIVRSGDKKKVDFGVSQHDTYFEYTSLKDSRNKEVSKEKIIEYASVWSTPTRSVYSSIHSAGKKVGTKLPANIAAQLILPKQGFDHSTQECASGVHFFIHSDDALAY